MYQQLWKWCSDVSTTVKTILQCINSCQNGTAMYQQLSKWYSVVSTAVKIPILTVTEFLSCIQGVTNASCAKGLCWAMSTLQFNKWAAVNIVMTLGTLLTAHISYNQCSVFSTASNYETNCISACCDYELLIFDLWSHIWRLCPSSCPWPAIND